MKYTWYQVSYIHNEPVAVFWLTAFHLPLHQLQYIISTPIIDLLSQLSLKTIALVLQLAWHRWVVGNIKCQRWPYNNRNHTPVKCRLSRDWLSCSRFVSNFSFRHNRKYKGILYNLCGSTYFLYAQRPLFPLITWPNGKGWCQIWEPFNIIYIYTIFHIKWILVPQNVSICYFLHVYLTREFLCAGVKYLN